MICLRVYDLFAKCLLLRFSYKKKFGAVKSDDRESQSLILEITCCGKKSGSVTTSICGVTLLIKHETCSCGVQKYSIISRYRLPFTVTVGQFSISKKYGPIIPPDQITKQTVSFIDYRGAR